MPADEPPVQIHDVVRPASPHPACPAHGLGPGETRGLHRRGEQRISRRTDRVQIFRCRTCEG